jgi:hypothetical protein
MKDQQEELLAAYAHEAWAGWMRYMFDKGEWRIVSNDQGLPVKVWFMPDGVADRWTRQMNTPYAHLPESEKESDRAEAQKIRKLLGLVL